MKTNMGALDRVIRIVLALVAVLLVYLDYVTGSWGYIALTFAAVFALTSLVSFCPLYGALGINSCGVKRKRS
ncbi:YgaP family membrane protein [Poritiphilus flavus]|uniref:DUF2892 domain-containing protein n=1 Tax=Poritiphilus flavus TaxID=2697053 RepID=A0A6L9EI10_9FLAO|nr:DUF2892 domain-containing protein [Poritiphilus flavus]NAS14285.1 DUF2892 domain-containing protein [Poritiphilus flavus]